MNFMILAGITLVVALRCTAVLVPMAAKNQGGHFPKKLQLWMLGEARNAKTPNPDDVVM